ncbi:zinc finger protein 503 [Bombina bombina]|uniref:zinc finger protein 503 n=1 Tax=Bombina bombina TaxID=8345 RepID=UPI00235B076C|nr:zinc finger protein 503 [Bombina bombina]
MISSPSASGSRVSPLTRESGDSAGRSPANRAFIHSLPPSDPLRQAGRLPIKVLKMLTARSGHILHPEYLQPLPSTPVSPIELDAKKSPLALLAQTCSQIGKPDPTPSKLSSVTGSSSSSEKEQKSGPLKLSDIGNEDKSSFKPYSKQSDKKESSSGDKSGFRVPSAACPPFTPRTGSPGSPRTPPLSANPKSPNECAEKKDADQCPKSAGQEGGAHGRLSVDLPQAHNEGSSGCKSISAAPSPTPPSSSSSSNSVLGSGLVAPVSPYKPGHTVFPLPPAGMSYPGTLASAYAGYAPQFLAHGVSLDPSKGNSLVGAQLGTLGCSGKSAASSPLTGASPPSVMTASLCRDPYCLSYHCASQLGASANCGHDLKSGYPLMYPSHALHGVSPPSLQGHPLYPYGFMLPNDPQPHVCNWVSATGPCDKRFSSSEELLGHLRTHTAFPGATDKLLPGYPSSSSLAAAAMACHMHMPPTGGSPNHLTLRSPHHHALGLSSSRYHPYSKSPLPSGGAPVPMPAATGHYYSPYALYGQRLTTASALGYQ